VIGVQITGTDSTITTNIQTEGAINSSISFTGKPAFIDSTQVFYLDEFDYTLASRQTLLRMADRLFNERMRRSFEQAMHYSLADQVNQARQALITFLSDYKLYNQVLISGSLAKFQLAKISTDAAKVNTLFDIQGQARIRLLNLGK
jgi:hypothetical protein